jgi:hypothetical protein
MVIAPACAYDCKVGCAPSQSKARVGARVGARGGRSSQDGASQQQEAAPLFLPQLERLNEAFLVRGEEKNGKGNQNIPWIRSDRILACCVNSSGRVQDDFLRLLSSALAGELPEESDQFRFLRAACLANLEGSVGLILEGASAMRVTVPLDLSTRPFIPLPRFFRSRRAPPLLTLSLRNALPKRHMMCVHFLSFSGFTVHHSCSVTFFSPWLSPFFILL